jgi:hypothetical protein
MTHSKSRPEQDCRPVVDSGNSDRGFSEHLWLPLECDTSLPLVV